jgi:hypothetical protein
MLNQVQDSREILSGITEQRFRIEELSQESHKNTEKMYRHLEKPHKKPGRSSLNSGCDSVSTSPLSWLWMPDRLHPANTPNHVRTVSRASQLVISRAP